MVKKENVFFKWPVIALAVLLLWPVGLVLVALKFAGLQKQYAGEKLLPESVVPFKEEKSTAQIKVYRNHLNKHKQKLATALATMVIGLLVGCAGITYFCVQIITNGYEGNVLPSLGVCALFAMVGIMQGMKGYELLEEKKRLAMMAALIDDRAVVTEAELQERSGLSREEVRTSLQTMFDRCYFADGVRADEEAGTFICYRK